MVGYKEIEGDLLDLFDEDKFDVIAHGCNCHKIMGAGIALQIANKYEHVKVTDKGDRRDSLSRLGDFSLTLAYTPKYIFNLYTQYLPGKNLDYEALALSLRKMSMCLDTKLSIGLPQIGCGIAGGDWERVKKIIQKELKDFDVTVVKYKQNK